MSRKNIIFRVDGNSKIGLGHLYRTIALAEMLKNDFSVKFLIRYNSNVKLLGSSYFEYDFIPENIALIEEPNWIRNKYSSINSIIVIDGYEFTFNYQDLVMKNGFKLVLIDDLVSKSLKADLIINHSPWVSEQNYIVDIDTNLALGSKYALLRKPFLNNIGNKSLKRNQNAFVCFGGADSQNFTFETCKNLVQINEIKYINVVIGQAYKNSFKEKLEKLHNKLKIFHDVSSNDLVKIMMNSDFAIAPCSNIVFELFSCKVPVIGGYYVDNQLNTYNFFAENETIIPCGSFNDLNFNNLNQYYSLINDNKIRISLKNKMAKIIDGKQNQRIINLFNSLVYKQS